MPCHVVGGVRCQVDHCSLQVCHLSQSTSRDIWQPALHQRPQALRVDERGVNNPPEKRERMGEKNKTHTMRREGITAQNPALFHSHHFSDKNKGNYTLKKRRGISDGVCRHIAEPPACHSLRLRTYYTPLVSETCLSSSDVDTVFRWDLEENRCFVAAPASRRIHECISPPFYNEWGIKAHSGIHMSPRQPAPITRRLLTPWQWLQAARPKSLRRILPPWYGIPTFH